LHRKNNGVLYSSEEKQSDVLPSAYGKKVKIRPWQLASWKIKQWFSWNKFFSYPDL